MIAIDIKVTQPLKITCRKCDTIFDYDLSYIVPLPGEPCPEMEPCTCPGCGESHRPVMSRAPKEPK